MFSFNKDNERDNSFEHEMFKVQFFESQLIIISDEIHLHWEVCKHIKTIQSSAPGPLLFVITIHTATYVS